MKIKYLQFNFLVAVAVICSVLPVFGEDCTFDDRFEDNDAIEFATPLILPADEGILISNYLDYDFYTFEVCAGGTLYIDCFFTHADGDIDISLLKLDGTQLAISSSSTDNEQIVYNVTTNETLAVMVRMYSYQQCNTYRLRVGMNCPENEEICYDGVDNDGDGDVDCDDYGCVYMEPDYFGITSPYGGEVVSGVVVIEGSADDNEKLTDNFYYTIHYGPAGGGTFSVIDPYTPVYTVPVINDYMGMWDTTALGVPDGEYRLEFHFYGSCNVWEQDVYVAVDNTHPLCEISSPASCDALTGTVGVSGTADDENLSSWVLEYADPQSNYWSIIASGTEPVTGGVLAQWDTSSLPSCNTTLQLIVMDQGGHISEYVVPVKVGLSADITDDKEVNLSDLAELASQYLDSW